MAYFFLILGVLVLLFTGVMLYRNQLTYKWRIRFLDEMKPYLSHKYYDRLFAEFERRTYNDILWDFGCWTYEDVAVPPHQLIAYWEKLDQGL